MEAKRITCETFHAVFGTDVSEQGALNLVRHEEHCSACARFAAVERRFHAAVEKFREEAPDLFTIFGISIS